MNKCFQKNYGEDTALKSDLGTFIREIKTNSSDASVIFKSEVYPEIEADSKNCFDEITGGGFRYRMASKYLMELHNLHAAIFADKDW